jgi:hypothetical protein
VHARACRTPHARTFLELCDPLCTQGAQGARTPAVPRAALVLALERLTGEPRQSLPADAVKACGLKRSACYNYVVGLQRQLDWKHGLKLREDVPAVDPEPVDPTAAPTPRPSRAPTRSPTVDVRRRRRRWGVRATPSAAGIEDDDTTQGLYEGGEGGGGADAGELDDDDDDAAK